MSNRKLSLGADRALKLLQVALQQYERTHPGSCCECYRMDEVTINVRVIDPRFSKLGLFDRLDLLRADLTETVPRSVRKQFGLLVPIGPRQKKTSGASAQFDLMREAA